MLRNTQTPIVAKLTLIRTEVVSSSQFVKFAFLTNSKIEMQKKGIVPPLKETTPLSDYLVSLAFLLYHKITTFSIHFINKKAENWKILDIGAFNIKFL